MRESDPVQWCLWWNHLFGYLWKIAINHTSNISLDLTKSMKSLHWLTKQMVSFQTYENSHLPLQTTASIPGHYPPRQLKKYEQSADIAIKKLLWMWIIRVKFWQGIYLIPGMEIPHTLDLAPQAWRWRWKVGRPSPRGGGLPMTTTVVFVECRLTAAARTVSSPEMTVP